MKPDVTLPREALVALHSQAVEVLGVLDRACDKCAPFDGPAFLRVRMEAINMRDKLAAFSLSDGTATRWYLNEYVITREFGGPEEGGWYYDAGEFIGSHGDYARREVAERARDRRMDALGGEIAASTIGQSVEMGVSGGEILASAVGQSVRTIYIEKEPGRDFPAERPHYE